jgi:molybdate/tungstate transport system substrate-binding protein
MAPSAAPSTAPSPMAARSVVIVVVIIVALAGIGVGFIAGYEYRGSPASSPAAVTNDTLSILGAGTLDTLFPQLASLLVNETPNISAPTAAQTYEGSLDITTAITTLAARADVAAVADFRLIPSLLEPKFASYEVVWGATPEVLVYNSSIPAFDGVNETNWAQKLINDVDSASNAPMAVWNASTDPNGYNEIFSLELQGMLYDNNASKFYSQLYGGAPGTPAIPNATKVGNHVVAENEHESQAATLLRTGVVSALITYRSYAVVNHLPYVSFNPIVGLYANNSTALSDYAKLSTTIVSSTGAFVTVVPAPVLFSITVPTNAQNPALGAAFIHLLLSPQGSAIISEGGAFTPIFPGWSNDPSAVPSVLAPDVGALPSWASPFLN